jgi:hypothetical protein
MGDSKRQVKADGLNAVEALRVLAGQIPKSSIAAVRDTAKTVIARSVDPKQDNAEHSDGLVYGMVQSGKTGVLTVAAAMAADNGYDGIIVLTSDNDELYDQTVVRVKQTLRGVTVLGKNDWKDPVRFRRHIGTPFAIVCSKNRRMLTSLLEAFKGAKVRSKPIYLVDDEADQASLNTKARKPREDPSKVNAAITSLRNYFDVNTYLQVTATPQALFLQPEGHSYRPSFTVLTHPGPDYIGGDDFFGEKSTLLDYVDLAEVNELAVGNQPAPNPKMPPGLRRSLVTFLVAAGARALARPDDNFAYLCHVSMATKVHTQIVGLIDEFRDKIITTLKDTTSKKYADLVAEMQKAYDGLRVTEPSLPDFAKILSRIGFLIAGASVKLINATSSDEIELTSGFNFLVGGTKLGRGVTIPNLLISYYGRNPKKPNADTVLQHARMYGYRRRDIGVTRLFLPEVIADNFRSIHQMDNALRHLIESQPDGRFEGLFLRGPVRATRTNVVPDAVGMYVAGRSIVPRLPLRTAQLSSQTAAIDKLLSAYPGDAPAAATITHAQVLELLKHVKVDPDEGAYLWDPDAIAAALAQLETINKTDQAYLVIRRGRELEQKRAETQGILSGGEDALAPKDHVTLFMYRLKRSGSKVEVWWPQLRFSQGDYAFAFALG